MWTPRIWLILSFASILVPTLARQTPTSYCKCICFQNSTIIPLNSPPEKHTPSADEDPSRLLPRVAGDLPANIALSGRDDNGEGNQNKHHRTLTCSDCNRAFCLDYNLPICKGAKEEDVFTSCFQRDSVKDETVVLLFVLLTASLLSWAVLKPWIEKFRGVDSVAKYMPVAPDRSRGGLLPRTEASRDGNNGARARGDSDSGSVARQGGLNS